MEGVYIGEQMIEQQVNILRMGRISVSVDSVLQEFPKDVSLDRCTMLGCFPFYARGINKVPPGTKGMKGNGGESTL